MVEENTLLSVDNLKLYYSSDEGTVNAVDEVSFKLPKGPATVIVGESGCGKSSLARAILRLLPNNVDTYSGRVKLDGEDLMQLGKEEFRKGVRWTKMSMVSQSAMSSLNPVVKVGKQVAEPLHVHDMVNSKGEAQEKVQEAFERVEVPKDFLDRYPFELSGGMRQRSVIAMALVTNPQLVFLDEPTSALDILTQTNIMNSLKKVEQELDVTFTLITHDVSTSSELAQRAMVMYAGHIVEITDAEHFFGEPLHPYSRKLMASIPTLHEEKELEFIPGKPPDLQDPPEGCRFADRCPSRFDKCSEEPPLEEVKEDHRVKCWLHL
ncbi:ABC transporter ATP-binding protein [Candidatus Bipolaricaulota bacterium]|nr:ABC transporter ATP-binding protein [Candidatus Bipolaricaulota bacterium]